MIETQSRSCGGWFQGDIPAGWWLRNHPSHDRIAIMLPFPTDTPAIAALIAEALFRLSPPKAACLSSPR